MATVDEVIVQFEAKLDSYNRDIQAATRQSERQFSAIEARGRKMGQGIKAGFGLAAAAATGFVASIGIDVFTQAISKGLDYASSLGEVAAQLGVTTDALQEYRYAGSQAGLTTEEIDQALSQLTRRIGEGASGAKAQAEAFKKLGISLKDAQGNVIATGDAIPQIADALQRIQSPAERAAILMDLFGRAGQKLEPLLAGGAKGVNGLRDAAQRLGVVLSSEQIAKADETADKLAELKQVLEAKIAGTVADNASSIVELANALVELVAGLGTAIKKYKEFTDLISNTQSAIKRGSGRLQTGFGIASGNPAFIQNGQRIIQQANGELAPKGPSDQGFSRRPRTSLKRNFAGTGLDEILGREGLGAPGAGTGLDIKNLGSLINIMAMPAKQAAARITALSVEVEQQSADLAIAMAELSGSVTERAAAEKLRIDADKRAEVERLKADKDLKAAARDEQIALVEKLASARKQLVDQRASEELSSQRRDADEKLTRAREENVSLELAALDAEADATRNVRERAVIEARILELQQQEERARLEAAIAAGEIADASKARADLARKQTAERTSQSSSKLAPGAAYLDDLQTKAANANEELEALAVGGLRDLSDGIGDAIANGGDLGDVLEDSFKRVIAQVISLGFELLIIKPLLESLKGTGGGGGIAGFIGSIFGRATGGPVTKGRPYLVGEDGPELMVPQSNGRVIPNGKLGSAGGMGGGVSTIRIELSGDVDARMVNVARGVSVEVVKAAAPSIVSASVSETFRQGQRPRL